jgi:hypothetical protein
MEFVAQLPREPSAARTLVVRLGMDSRRTADEPHPIEQ